MLINKLEVFFKKVRQKDLEITERFLGKSPFHCAYLVRKGLRNALKNTSVYARGWMLDAGCGLKPYEIYFINKVDRYIGLDYSPKSGYLGNKADVYGDVKTAPFKNNSFDTILCTEVLEHIETPDILIKEFFRIIRNNGRIIITSPFIYPLHSYSSDYFRFTETGLISLLQRYDFKILNAKTICGSPTTMAMLFNHYLYEECFFLNRFLYPFSILIRPILWVLIFIVNITTELLEKIIKTKSLAPFNHLVVAQAGAMV